MLSVIATLHNAIELVVVKPDQPLCALIVKPQPLLEFLPELLQLLPCGNRFLLIHDPFAPIIRRWIGNRRYLLIERLLKQRHRPNPLRTVGLRCCHRPSGGVVRVDLPCTGRRIELDAVSLAFHDFIQECLVVRCRYPDRPNPCTNFMRCKIIRNDSL